MNLLNRKPGKGPGSGSAAVIFRHGKKSLPAGRGRGAPWFFCAMAAWASLTLCAPAPARTISGTVTGNQYGSEISSGDVTGDLDLSGAHVIGDLIGGLTHDGKAVSSSVRSSGDAGDNINGSVTGGQGTNGAESNVVNLHWCQIVGSRISAGAHVEGGVTESGKAVGNSVTLTDTFLLRGNHIVTGGRTGSGEATGNAVTVTSGYVSGNVYGSYTGEGLADGAVNLNASLVTDSVYGGYSENGQAGGTVTITGQWSGVSVSGNVYGGFSEKNGSASGTVNLNGAVVSQSVYGGYAADGASDGTVNISVNSETGDLSTVSGSVYGGYSESGQAGGTVTITGGSVTGSVYGGRAEQGSAAAGTVTIGADGDASATGSVSGDVYGGWGAAGASSNTVLLWEGASVTGVVYGGFVSASGDATGNEVSLTNVSSAPQSVYGSYTASGTAGGTDESTRTTVTLTGSSVTGDVYGGYSGGGAASYSTVTGSENSTVGGSLYGGRGTAGASFNRVELSKVSVTGGVYGGYTSSGDATGNEVSLTNVSSAPRSVYGSYTASGTAGGTDEFTRTTVTLTGSSVTGDVYGGYSGSGAASYSTVTGSENSTVGGSLYGGRGTTGASSNTVNLNHVSVTGGIYGGYTASGDASDNTVSLSDGTTFDGDLYAGRVDVNGRGDATGNKVFLTKVSALGTVYASRTPNGLASGTVTLTDSTVEKNVYGGYTQSGTATGSSVSIINSVVEDTTPGDQTADGNVYGGYTQDGEASSNSVTVSGSEAFVHGNVYGGHGFLDTSYNIVVLTDGARVGADVFGGHSARMSSTSMNVVHNEVTLSSGSRAGGNIYGGMFAEGEASVRENAVKLDASFADGDIFGGMLLHGSGSVESNTVDISDGSVAGSVYGGAFVNYTNDADSGNVSGNAVTMSGAAAVKGSVFGGYIRRNNGNITGSRVTISDSASVEGSVYGAQIYAGAGNVTDNEVTVSGGSVKGTVYGGWTDSGDARGNVISSGGVISKGAEGGHTLSGNASGNRVIVEGGTIEDHLYGGYTETGDATGNEITVNGGTVQGQIAGGYTALGSATGNVITVKGGTVNAEITGGYDDGTATDNTVNLYDSASFTGSDIYGGRSGGSSSDVFTGNTFNVYGQIDAASLQNFQNLNFYDVAEDRASVDLSRSAVIGDGKGTMTNVFIGNLRNQEGDIAEEYVLIHTPTASSSYNGTNLYVNGNTVVTIGPDGSYVPYSGTVANDGTMDNATGSAGMTKSQALTKGFLTFEVDYFIKNGQDLIARWKKDAPVKVNPETKKFTSSRQASAALMDEGADFVSGEGIDRALQASQCLPGEPCGAKAFMAVSGGYSTYKAGTTFNMSYGNMLAGVARQCKIGPVGYLAGVFFETGLSRFHSEYEPDDSRSIDSEGHDYYYGAGALAKVFLNRDLLKGLYAEGSIRYGLMMGDWQSHDIQSDGQTADWDGRAPYLTAHGGLGYLWNVTDNVTADVYAKYFWGHLWGDDGTICGQKFEFDDIYSSRVRTGARLNFKKDETFSWYLGGAWEHQFDSKSRGTIYGYDVPSGNLKGNTAIAEAGVYFKPAAGSGFSFMFGTTGYFGEKREGVTGHLQVRYDF